MNFGEENIAKTYCAKCYWHLNCGCHIERVGALGCINSLIPDMVKELAMTDR